MEHGPTTDRNYWQLLDAAGAALDAGDFVAAERLFLGAEARRDASPGQVFVTESLADNLARLLRRRRGADTAAEKGRWTRRAEAFRAAFLAAGERAVREGVRLAELRPEDDAEANQPVLAAALFLVVRSRLFPEESASSVPLLKGLFRTAARTAQPFDVQLIRHDVPLTEEDRLWLARRGGDLLEIFLEQGRLQRGSGPAREWAAAVLQLLQPRYFGSSGRLAEERAWLEAVTADRLQGDAEASVRLYRQYLQTSPGPGPRADEARVRTLELLGNIDDRHFPVPRYGEALGALQSAGLAAGSEQAGRYGTAVARIEHRRPEAQTGAESAAWASAALGADGVVTLVFWWAGEPRDVAQWVPGQGTAALDGFLLPCAGRVVARDVATLAAVGSAWADGPAPWPVGGLVEVLAEPDLPREGLDEPALRQLAAAEHGAWRAGWRRELAVPDLRPADDWDTDPRAAAGLGRALLAGLVVVALRTRVAQGDPTLRAGLGELARRGDAAAGALYALLTCGDEAARAMDASFAAWTVPLLWTRPDPFARRLPATAAPDDGATVRPDLGRNDVAVVTTGDPAAVLAAWGAGRSRWRVVLDRMTRVADLAPTGVGVIGPVTVIPRDGLVHRLDAALARLDTLVRRRSDPDDPLAGLLAVFHWVRVVATHNGDLLDFQAVRPWRSGAFPLYDRYAGAIADLPRQEPRLAGRADDDGWAVQFSQRARKAGFVAGHVAQLVDDPARLDALWGVFEGSDASWVFLDGAAVHARLAAAGEDLLPARHALLQQRGRRHLTVLTGAVWCREDLEDLLAGWLAPYGPAYRLALTDLRTPPLLLADRGPVPGPSPLAGEALAAALAHVGQVPGDGPRKLVAAPAAEPASAFWRVAREGRFAVAGDGWDLAGPDAAEPPVGEVAVLVVPQLAALEHPAPAPVADDAEAWRAADEARARWAEGVRRRASLELAAHLAGAWAAVEVLDARWWRLLRDNSGAAPGDAAAPVWNGARAAALAAPGRSRTLDLPESAGDAHRRLPAALLAEVAAWLAGRGGPAGPDPAAAWPEPGARVQLGPAAADRAALQAAVARDWARGRLEAWILVVSPAPWPGAAAVVAGSATAGCSVWPAGTRPPAPVLWAHPADLADPALVSYLARYRPRQVVVPDFGGWLPGPDRPAQVEASALRALLKLEAPSLLLQAQDLPGPWCRFLAEATGLQVPSPGPAAAAPAAAERTAPRGPTLVARLRRLLASLRPGLEQRQAPAAAGRAHADLEGELASTTRLAHLAGLEPGQVRLAVRSLRWAARLAGDPLADAEGGAEVAGAATGRTHAVLIGIRYAELEALLAGVGDALDLFLPLWLGRLPAGGLTWIDLAEPPAHAAPDLLARIDAWLLGHGTGTAGLFYTAPRGVLGSTRRLLGCRRPLPEVQADLRGALGLFGRRVRDLMAAAVETGDGFLVDTGLTRLRPDEEAFLALGASLDLWRWFGPAGPGALPLVDLLTVADSPTVRQRDEAWALVSGLHGRPAAAGADDAARAAVPGGGRLRALLGQAGATETDDALVDLVARLAGGAPEPVFLVLKGLAGTGRLETVVAGLHRAAQAADDPGVVTVFCPDAATAAAAVRAAAARGLPLDLRLPVEADLPDLAAGSAGPAGRDDVVVVMDSERFQPEIRYRIAQHGRGRRLLMTVDPAAAAESWENLFLTTPRLSDVHELTEQRDQARRVWGHVRGLVPEHLAGQPRTRRRERGEVVAEYAANLDQCVARLLLAHGEGLLPGQLRLTAPLAADLDYLAGALRQHGWLVVDEEELDTLLLPGPCDLLAAAADVLAAAGVLRVVSPAEGPPAGSVLPDLLRALPGGATGEGDWPPQPLPDPAVCTLDDLARLLLSRPAAAPALRRPAARRRLAHLLQRWGDRPLAALPELPGWQAWWSVLRQDLGRTDPAPDRPLVRLCPAARSPGAAVAGGVYLCLGGEEVRQHYRILSRVRDAALVLYQDRSPLAQD